MLVFVRLPSGTTESHDATTLPALHATLSERYPALRLSHHSRTLPDDLEGSLESHGISEHDTLVVLGRLRGGGAKKRCGFFVGPTDRCSQAAARIVGDCTFCTTSFCSRHRLPEDHKCANMQGCRDEAFERNKSKLEREMTTGKKIESM